MGLLLFESELLNILKFTIYNMVNVDSHVYVLWGLS